MQKTPTVAILGLGAMGHAFATNLLKAGFPLRVWNRTPSRGDDLAHDGAHNAATPSEAASEARFVITMVPDFDTTHEVLLGDEGALASLPERGVVVQMGTIGDAQTQRLISEVRNRRPDVTFIDAPVSGTKAPAEQAKITVLASGDREAAEGIDALFDAISARVEWLGEAGAGSRMKLVVNAWLIHMMQGIAESAGLAQQFGFSIDEFWQILDGGPLAAPYAKAKLGMIESGDYSAQMALSWGLKDARLALEAGGENSMPALKHTSELWAEAEKAGLGDADIAVIHDYLKRLAD
ncbi:NAD(P)-dependent oxidoreductase [Kushneria aurantia]|uniref:NAD(P)-dependent oxidoreductase n=1 Tax=Kushneria aurantia TaxID=504092 RepID=A0ABV6G231_9GAMM|nr:NAD(P)-dependent oxidoreductase [Kushneria aurantia]